MRLGPAIATAASAFCLGSLALAAWAEASIYWADDGWAAIGRANVDGGESTHLFTGPEREQYALDVAVDARHVFWSESETGRIWHSDLDGSDEGYNVVKPVGQITEEVFDLAVDASHVYWIDNYEYGDEHRIGRMNPDGSGVIERFITLPSHLGGGPSGIAVDAGHVYWTTDISTIGRANLDGSDANSFFIVMNSSSGVYPGLGNVTVDAGHVYWTEVSVRPYRIGRANLDGSGVDPSFITLPRQPARDIAVDGGHIYWTHGNKIARANLDGSGVDPRFITIESFHPGQRARPVGIAVNADNPPPGTWFYDKRKKGRRVVYEFVSETPNSTFECRLKGPRLKRSVKRFGACASPLRYKHLKKGKYKFQVRAINARGDVDPSPATDTFKVVG